MNDQKWDWTETDNLAEKVKVIDAQAIKLPEADPAKRTFDEEFAKKLADSIERETLLKAPMVKDLGDGTYLLIDGRHRVHACREILGWTRIPCTVVGDDREQLVEAIELATNLLSLPLNESQRRGAIQRLLELYKTQHPERTLKGGWLHGESFAKVITQTLKVSPAQANRYKNTAERIDNETRATLEGAGATQTQIDQIATLKEPEAINSAAALIAAGKDVDEAFREAKKIKKQTKAEKAKAESKANGKTDNAVAEPPNESEMTDQEWLDTYCSKVMGCLAVKAGFRADAILYRRINQTLVKFRGSVKKQLKEAKLLSGNGGFYSVVKRLVKAAHPMHWLICDGCFGKVHPENDKTVQCNKCYGSGYKLKIEDW